MPEAERRPEPPPGGPPTNGGERPTIRPGVSWRWWVAAALLVLAALAIPTLFGNQASVRYDELKAQLKAGNVSSLSFTGTDVTGEFRKAVSINGTMETTFKSRIPDFTDPGFVTLLDDQRVPVTVQSSSGGIMSILGGLLPFILLGLLWFWMMRRASGGAAGALDFGRSRARVQLPGGGPPSTTFADVAGVDEAKAELQQIVQFLREPAHFTRLGGRMPRGVLLLGAPGTGKTLLARAVAGEARVPFFSISASEFVEMFVGVGAARVRSLFEEAKKNSPAVIFVDELDAVGRQRGAGLGGGHDEREQTLNQLLVEMDGFDPGVGIIVMAASNRPDVLDPALLRPGRFDRRVTVGSPDRRGRRAILEVHTRTVPIGQDVDLEVLAGSTTGLVGADLANLVNEAALQAAQAGHEMVMMEDFEVAFDRLLLGPERKLLLTEEDRRVIAYHESGHAVVAWFVPAADPVRKITIVPRGETLGVTHSMPTEDRYNVSEEYLRARLAMAMGGRAAEELAIGSVTTGAQNDLETATEMARRMVTTWGMSRRMGLLSYDESNQAVFLGRELAGMSHVSPETQNLVDEETREILAEGMRTAGAILREHRAGLDHLARALLRDEVLEEDQILAILGPRTGGKLEQAV